MKIQSLPKADKPIDISYLSKLGIQSYDRDNLYPQNVDAIVSRSKNGTGCLERYGDYIEGDGIASAVLASFVINRSGESLDTLHQLAAQDLAKYNGFAIHLNYDINGKVIEINHVPFENVRLCEPDEDGYVKQVALHPDWTGQLTRNGKKVPVKKENIDYIDIFNPDPQIILQQMLQAGGPQYYKGQVLYVSMYGYMRYPLAYYDAVLTDMSTDEGLSNLNLRNARNNFLPAGFFVHFKSQGAPGESYDDEDENDDTSQYSEDLAALQGDENSLNILDITVESKEEMPEFVPFANKNIDKDFTNTATEVKEAIYAKFGQEIFLALRNGKVGFSGTLVKDATDDYARRCAKKQRKLTEAYLRILQAWGGDPLPEMPTMESLAIRPITVSVTTTTE